MSIVAIEHLTKRYGSRTAVDDLSLSLEEGTVCGFLGPNGVGKTTTIRVLLGLLRPTEGRARIFGLDCWREGARIREEVGYLPGDLRLYSWLTARRALALFGRIRGRDITGHGLELADAFGLDLDVRVGNMSRGMRQKLGIILALAPRPRLLILDEPTASLDPVVQKTLKEMLFGLAERGHTVFFSSHTLSEVEQLCKRVVILRAGHVVADASIQDLRARAPREVVVRWDGNGGQGVEPPPCLKLLERKGPVWRANIAGPMDELLGWLAAQRLEDVVIGRPDLGTLFQRYYEE